MLRGLNSFAVRILILATVGFVGATEDETQSERDVPESPKKSEGVLNRKLRPIQDGWLKTQEQLQARRSEPNQLMKQIKLPLTFQKNQGQSDSSVQYLAHGQGWGVSLKPDRAVMTMRCQKVVEPNLLSTQPPGPPSIEQTKTATVELKFLGTTPAKLIQGEKQRTSHSNYLLGNDPSHWVTEVVSYDQVRYADLYPGIDLLFHGNGDSVQFDFLVRAGINPKSIRLGFTGAKDLELEPTGDLRINAGESFFRLLKPVVYQEEDGNRHFVDGSFNIVRNLEVQFQLGPYDPAKILIIDPIPVYSLDIVGNGSNSAFGVGTDELNNLYVGINTTVTNLTAATNSNSGSGDIAVAKFNSIGDWQWTTYVGGNGFDTGRAIDVSSDGTVTGVGGTTSLDFPIIAGGPQATYGGGGYDGVIFQLTKSGTASRSTYVGGGHFDWLTSLRRDSLGTIYFSGSTQSSNLQTTANAIQKTYGGGTCSDSFGGAGGPCPDAMWGVLENGANQWKSLSYLGGNKSEGFYNYTTTDTAGNMYLFGITNSLNFPLKNPVQSYLADNSFDLFFTKCTSNFSLGFSTYFGGDSTEVATNVLLGRDGNLYTTAYTFSENYPVTVDALQTTSSGKGDSDGAITSWTGEGHVVDSTRFGGSANEMPTGLIWTMRGLYVTGNTLSSDFRSTDNSRGGNGVFISEDDGENWERNNFGLGGLAGGFLSFDLSDSLKVNYVQLDGDTYQSQDGGNGFKIIGQADTPTQFFDVKGNSSFLYGATSSGLKRLQLTGQYGKWEPVDGFDPNEVVTSLSTDPKNSQSIFTTAYSASSEKRLRRSLNFGATWENKGTGLPTGVNLRYAASNGDNLFVGTTSGTTPFYKCDATGNNCSPSGAGLIAAPVNQLFIDPQKTTDIYAIQPGVGTLDGGLFKSTDGGNNFQQILKTKFTPNWGLKFQDGLYLGASSSSGYGVIKSPDGGLNWYDKGLNRNEITRLFGDPSNPHRLLAVSRGAVSGFGAFIDPNLKSHGFCFYNPDNAKRSRNGLDAVGKYGKNLVLVGTYARHSGTNALSNPTPSYPNFGVTANIYENFAGSPELELIKDASPPIAQYGQRLEYTITIHNKSKSNAANVKITDRLNISYELDPTASFIEGTGQCDISKGEFITSPIVECKLSSPLPPDGIAIVNLYTTLRPKLDGPLANAFGDDEINEATATATVDGHEVSATDSVTVKLVDPQKIRVTNIRANAAIPGTTVAIEGSQLNAVTGITLNGVNATIVGNSGSKLFVRVPEGVSGQLTANLSTSEGSVATVAGVQIDSPKADVAVERIFQAVNQSQKTIVYSITVTNRGPSTASNVVVDIGAGKVAGLLATEITPPSGANCNNTGSQCTIPTLAPGDTKVIGLVFNFAGFSGGTLINQVSISSSTPDPNSANNSKGVSTNSASAVPQISGISPSSGAPGSNLTINGSNLNSGAPQLQSLRARNSAAVNTSTTVSFGTVPAEIVSISNTQIVVEVPAGAATGPVTVTTPNSSVNSPSPFTISDGSSGTVTQFVPVVLTAAGLNNSFFTTELTLTNRGATQINLNLTYTGAFGGGGGSANASLPPGQQYVIDNAIEWLRGLGISIPDSGNRGGTLAIRASGFILPSDFAATARTTTAATGGRAGLAYSGVQTLNALTEPSFIYGLRQTSQDRANLAVQHAGRASDGNIVLRLTVYSGDPANPSVTPLPDINLVPGGFFQISGILTSNGLNLSNGFVKAERLSGSAPYYAYGVVNDQANSDGSFIPPVPESASAGATALTVPVIVEANTFSSELTATNRASVAKTVRLSYVASAIQAPNATANFTLNLQPQEQLIIPGLVQYLRNKPVAGIGPKGPAFAGALFATVDGEDVNDIFLGVRTSAPGAGGQFGLFYVGVPKGQAFDGDGWLFGLQQDQLNRSNVAMVNTGETDNSDNHYVIELYDGSSGLKAATIPDFSLGARSWKQIGTVLASYASGVNQGYARIMRTSGNNPSIYYGVINDGGQPGERTGDGAYIPASE